LRDFSFVTSRNIEFDLRRRRRAAFAVYAKNPYATVGADLDSMRSPAVFLQGCIARLQESACMQPTNSSVGEFADLSGHVSDFSAEPDRYRVCANNHFNNSGSR
jgi:hypothetical protein